MKLLRATWFFVGVALIFLGGMAAVEAHNDSMVGLCGGLVLALLGLRRDE